MEYQIVEMIKQDIEKCNELIKKGYASEDEEICLVSKYKKIDKTFGSELHNYVKTINDSINHIKNIKIIKNELEALLILNSQDKNTDVTSNNESNNKTYDKSIVNNNNIFIVHGRNNEKKDEIADFVRDLGLNPIILHEQPNIGVTIIEKIEKNAENVSSAIILFTPDDEGKLKSSENETKTRARQNVIFEAGYFMGKLGRNRVAILNGVEETMSDINGIVYIPLDNYKSALRKELKEMGYKING